MKCDVMSSLLFSIVLTLSFIYACLAEEAQYSLFLWPGPGIVDEASHWLGTPPRNGRQAGGPGGGSPADLGGQTGHPGPAPTV